MRPKESELRMYGVLRSPPRRNAHLAKVPNNKNCVLVGPGNSEHTPAVGKNPNIYEDFQPPGRS